MRVVAMLTISVATMERLEEAQDGGETLGSDSSKMQVAVGHGWFGLWNVIEGTTVVGCEHLGS
jgi:hypothetical protein